MQSVREWGGEAGGSVRRFTRWSDRLRAALESLRGWRPSRVGVVVASVAAALGLLAGLLAWSFASPYGTTPDEDFHMISITCPHPGQGGCTIVGWNQYGAPVITVASRFAARGCMVDQAGASVACTYATGDGTVWSDRVNYGGYPGYYYMTMHVFASSDIDRMTLAVRVTNSVIAVAFVLLLLVLMNAAARRIYVWTLAVTSVAGMAWLVGSAAPDSWSIVGVTTVWAGMTGALLATVRWRRYGLLAAAIVGALLASAARSDAGIYVLIATAAPCIIHWRRLQAGARATWDLIAAPILTFAIGAAALASGGQISGMVASGCGVWCAPIKNPQGPLHLMVNNVVYFFEWITDAWRRSFDLLQPQIAAFALFTCAVVVVGAALARGGMTVAKALALVMTTGALIGAPILSLQMGHSLWSMGQGGLAPRYLFPILITLVGVALTPTPGAPARYLSLRSVVMLWGVVAVVQAVYLHQWIRRCVTGVAINGFSLTPGAQWWWASGPSPMTVWVIGSVGFAIASAAVVLFWWQPRFESDDVPRPSPSLVSPIATHHRPAWAGVGKPKEPGLATAPAVNPRVAVARARRKPVSVRVAPPDNARSRDHTPPPLMPAAPFHAHALPLHAPAAARLSALVPVALCAHNPTRLTA